MYAKGRREIVVFGYALLVAVLFCLAGMLFGGGCSRSDAPTAGGNGERAAEQVDRATELNQQAGAALKSAAGAVERAERHADRAEQLNQSAQARAEECQKLVSELKADNQRAKQIINEFVSNAQARATQDAAR